MAPLRWNVSERRARLISAISSATMLPVSYNVPSYPDPFDIRGYAFRWQANAG